MAPMEVSLPPQERPPIERAPRGGLDTDLHCPRLGHVRLQRGHPRHRRFPHPLLRLRAAQAVRVPALERSPRLTHWVTADGEQCGSLWNPEDGTREDPATVTNKELGEPWGWIFLR